MGKKQGTKVTKGRTEEQEKWPVPTQPRPSLRQLQNWTLDGVCEATDGCRVEPDGRCPHGHPAWLMYLGYV